MKTIFAITLLISAVCFGSDTMTIGKPDCLSEIKKLCPNMRPGEELHNCIETNISGLSSQCQERHKEISAKRDKMKQSGGSDGDKNSRGEGQSNSGQRRGPPANSSCKSDFDTYCSSKRGPDMKDCVESNLTNFSSACQSEVEEMKSRMGNRGSRQGGR